jgi:hypothetical protein
MLCGAFTRPQWVMGSKLILDYIEAGSLTVEVDDVAIGNVLLSALGADLLLDVDVDAIGAK